MEIGKGAGIRRTGAYCQQKGVYMPTAMTQLVWFQVFKSTIVKSRVCVLGAIYLGVKFDAFVCVLGDFLEGIWDSGGDSCN